MVPIVLGGLAGLALYALTRESRAGAAPGASRARQPTTPAEAKARLDSLPLEKLQTMADDARRKGNTTTADYLDTLATMRMKKGD